MNIKKLCCLGMVISTACIGMDQPQLVNSCTYRFRKEFCERGSVKYEKPVAQRAAWPEDPYDVYMVNKLLHQDTWWWISVWFPGLTEEKVEQTEIGTAEMPFGVQVIKEADAVYISRTTAGDYEISVQLNEQNRIAFLNVADNNRQSAVTMSTEDLETPLGRLLVCPADGLPTRLDVLHPADGCSRIDKIGISVNCELSRRKLIDFGEARNNAEPYVEMKYPMMSSNFLDCSAVAFQGLPVTQEMDTWKENITKQHIGSIFRYSSNGIDVVNAEATREWYEIRTNYKGWVTSVNYKKTDEEGNLETDVLKEVDELYYYEPDGTLHFDFYNRDEEEIQEIEASGQDPYTGAPGDWAAKYPY